MEKRYLKWDELNEIQQDAVRAWISDYDEQRNLGDETALVYMFYILDGTFDLIEYFDYRIDGIIWGEIKRFNRYLGIEDDKITPALIWEYLDPNEQLLINVVDFREDFNELVKGACKQ